MALDFALAVAAGVVIALLSQAIQKQRQRQDSVLELTRRSTVIIRSGTLVDGISEGEITLIEESTFRFTESAMEPDRRLSFLAGFIIFGIVLAALLLL